MPTHGNEKKRKKEAKTGKEKVEDQETEDKPEFDGWFPVSLWTIHINSSGSTWITFGDLRYTITGPDFLLMLLDFLLTARAEGLGPCKQLLIVLESI